ncbi:MAG TPA: hypothetical protein P5186_29450 [Candidatus Paceibacterota bacterium]|nr:hypothetical protein [Candidatus Paceibacterota bacterium]HSA02088.1 hypothetical protein [Candidatus Paceibacterota bacterium]
MNPSLQEFRSDYQSRLLDFVWRQWSALGVAGQTEVADQRIVDLEALLLLTCTIGRYDPRLFDEVLDWLQANSWLINIMRLKRILRTEKFAGERVLASVAGLFAKGAEAPKWKQLAASSKLPRLREQLFFDEGGQPIPIIGKPEPNFVRYGLERGPLRLRGYSREFRPMEPATLILQLRALFGINARCEIVAYLLTHDAAHPSQIARKAHYFTRAVQGTLVDMSRSGVIQVRLTGREKHYWLKQDSWKQVLNRGDSAALKWINWPPLFSALEQIWLRLQDEKLLSLEPLLQASELRQFMAKVRPSLERAGFDRELSDDRHYLGESYLPVFIDDVRKLLP